MDISATADEKIEFMRNSSFRGSEDIGGDSAFYEKFLLEDWDSYWDDLNSRLTVSRMVNDSIIKGMVSGVVEEADEKIALKDTEIAMLKDRLRNVKSQLQSSSDVKTWFRHTEKFASLHMAVEEQLGNVRRVENLAEVDERVDCLKALLEVVFRHIDDMLSSPEVSVCEQQIESEVQREIMDIVTRDSIRTLYDEFERKLYEQRKTSDALSMNWQTTLDELTNMREELDVITRSFSLEPGSLLSYNSIENFEERHGTKGKDSPRNVFGNHHVSVELQYEESGISLIEKRLDSPKPMLDDADSPKLKHMTKEEVITYYRTEMLKMSRQHDQLLQDKTEQLFKLKREFLKEKGSSHVRKDKDLDVSKKKIPEIIAKLDNILFLNKKLPMVSNDHDELFNLKKRIDALLFENQRLRLLLTDEQKEVKSLLSQVSDARSQMLSLEGSYVEQINKLKWDVEDMKIEGKIRGHVYNSVLKELVDEHKSGMEDMQCKIHIIQDIDFLIFEGVVHDAILVVNPSDSRDYVEKASLEGSLSEKEKALFLALEENKKLKCDLVSLVASMKEKEKLVSEAEFRLVQQENQFDVISQELVVLREQLCDQEALLTEKNTELESMKGRLDETLQRIQQYELEAYELNEKFNIASGSLMEVEEQNTILSSRLDETLQQIQQYELDTYELNEKFKIASESLMEVEEQNNILSSMVEEKQKSFSSSITKENAQAIQMKSFVVALVDDLENRLDENLQRNESRLKLLNHHCLLLRQHASLLRKKEFWYQQILEIKSCNLQKAEAEVDLLGDEVDALMSLLGKIYIALDHYSPIFQLYPGVMDILKLIQMKLKGEANILV